MTKYIARLDGKIIGTRKSDRVYTHAIITQAIEAVARDRAYNRSAIKQDRKNFSYYAEKAAAGLSHPHYFGSAEDKAAEWAKDVERVAAGVDAYIEEQRQHVIAGFEASLKAGKFYPCVAAWAGRLDLAQKAARQFTNAGVKLIAIVPAEVA